MVGDLIAGRYELLELVGTGGMSSVYRAHDSMLARDVALKILHDRYSGDAAYIERFRHEARSVAQLTNPNIVMVFEVGPEDGPQFIVFEFVDGENVKELIRREGPLPVRQALQIAIQAASALTFAHRQGLVHRDVKPQNILLTRDGRARVTDFGIARTLEVEGGMTLPGTVLGTASYIAPEQARGEPVNALTDVYSLGAVLYEMLTGEVPYDGENFVAVAMQHVNEPPPSVLEIRIDVPFRVDAAVRRAMAKHPDDRFASMEAFQRELQACLADLGPDPDAEDTLIVHGDPFLLQEQPLPPPKPGRRARYKRIGLILLLILALAVAAGAAVLISRDNSGSRTTSTEGSGTTTRTVPVLPVHLKALTVYDPPPGDGTEHDRDVPFATDGDPTTFWTTESYKGGTLNNKPGVGIVLDASRRASPREIVVITGTPGYTAEIRAGDSPGGPFDVVSPSQTVANSTTFPIKAGTKARYYVVWITHLDGERAYVNEVRASP